MPEQQAINTFAGGMNKDIDLSSLPKNTFIHAENVRIVTNSESTSTSLEVIEGNSIQSMGNSTLPIGYQIIGYCNIRNTIVFFVTNNTYSIIYKANVINGVIQALTTVYNDASSPDSTRFNFSTSYPIKAIGRYESNDIIKVYWTDDNNRLRFINIADSNNQMYSVNRFEIIPSFTQSPISITSIGSGNLEVGMVQYSYQLYNTYGAETAFTSPSSFVPLADASFSGNDYQFTGNNQGDKAGKSVTFSISNIDTNFNRIRIVRLHHTSLVDLPKINIIAELSTESSLSFTDTGTENIGELTPEEFNFVNYDFVCKDIDTKNNILFAAGIKENVWDVDYDARAYRFTWSSSPVGYVWDADGTNPLLVDRVNFNNVPETHDCYNKFNDFRNDDPATNQNCRAAGNQLGGSGKNIEYHFDITNKVLDSTINSPIVETNFSPGNTSSIYYKDIRGYQRDEIYSFAIVVMNTKGQRSYPKWIGDIRFPKMDDYYTYNLTSEAGGSGINSNILGITFIVKNLPNDCSAFQIVRCERKTEDRTIVAQGLVGMTREYNGGAGTFYCAFPTLSTIGEYESFTQPRSGLVANKTLLEFISPEISYNKNLVYSGGDVLEVCGIARLLRKYIVTTQTEGSTLTNNKSFNFGFNESFIINKVSSVTTDPTKKIRRNNIVDFKIASTDNLSPTSESPMNSVLTINGKTYENYSRKYTSVNSQGRHGTVGILAINSDISITSAEIADTAIIYGEKYMLANYRRPIQPYGGASYEARTRRVYIPCGDIYPTPNIGPGNGWLLTIRDGDTFVSKFEYQRIMVAGLDGETPIEESITESVIFPVETSINTRWQTNKTFSQLFTNSSATLINKNAITIQESAGVHNKDNGRVEAYFTQEHNLYTYNSVYSKQNNTTQFFPKPLDINENKVFDTRVIASDTKINGELSDSWAKFRLLQFKDVDSSFGKINNLMTYNNELLFWQDRAFGQLSVNQRSLLQDNNFGALTLGTGGILDRFDYISTVCGNISERGIIKSNSSLYWLDTLNTTLYRYSNNLEPLSKTKGLQSYLNTFVDKTTKCIGGAYDDQHSEIVMTLQNSSNSKVTIAYNELQDNFSSFYTFYPTQYISTFDGNYNTTLNNNTIYLHNSGNNCQFYGTTYPSIVRFAVNDNYEYTKVFDSLQYKTKSYNNSVLLFSDTFNTMKIWNDKQYTGEISIVMDNNTTKREQEFATIISRNIVNANIESNIDIFNPSNHNLSREFKERIRDKYAIIELKYNNTNGNTFSIPYVKTNYRISYR